MISKPILFSLFVIIIGLVHCSFCKAVDGESTKTSPRADPRRVRPATPKPLVKSRPVGVRSVNNVARTGATAKPSVNRVRSVKPDSTSVPGIRSNENKSASRLTRLNSNVIKPFVYGSMGFVRNSLVKFKNLVRPNNENGALPKK